MSRERPQLGAIAFVRIWVLAHTQRKVDWALMLAEGKAVPSDWDSIEDSDAWLRARQRATLACQRIQFASPPIARAASRRLNELLQTCVQRGTVQVFVMNKAVQAVDQRMAWEMSIGLRNP